jgi:hypothetical protein
VLWRSFGSFEEPQQSIYLQGLERNLIPFSKAPFLGALVLWRSFGSFGELRVKCLFTRFGAESHSIF